MTTARLTPSDGRVAAGCRPSCSRTSRTPASRRSAFQACWLNLRPTVGRGPAQSLSAGPSTPAGDLLEVSSAKPMVGPVPTSLRDGAGYVRTRVRTSTGLRSSRCTQGRTDAAVVVREINRRGSSLRLGGLTGRAQADTLLGHCLDTRTAIAERERLPAAPGLKQVGVMRAVGVAG